MRSADRTAYAVFSGGGGMLGCVYGLISTMTARANVATMPELANVDWFTALVADHLTDWVFYKYPLEATLGCTAAGAASAALLLYFLSYRR